jgi:hypothetical protein
MRMDTVNIGRSNESMRVCGQKQSHGMGRKSQQTHLVELKYKSKY